MRRQLICFITASLLIGLFSIDGWAGKRSRNSRASSHTRAKKESRGKASRGRLARGSRRERGSSRREGREVGRSQRLSKERIIVRGRHGRRLVRYRYVRRAESDQTASAPRPSPPRQSGGGIPSERVTEIQNALIKAGYLEGPASGQYDDNTIQAMKQFQSSNRLPETGAPSASTLKKLGVPKRSNDNYAVPVNSVSENEKKRPAP